MKKLTMIVATLAVCLSFLAVMPHAHAEDVTPPELVEETLPTIPDEEEAVTETYFDQPDNF